MEDTAATSDCKVCACLSRDYPVSFAIFALARNNRARVAQMLSEIGLFPGQEVILMKLAEKDGEPQKAICESIGLDHSTVAKSLLRLERGGLIARQKCREDARISKVYLTDKGRQVTHAIANIWSELEHETCAELTPAEREQLVALAEKILAREDRVPG